VVVSPRATLRHVPALDGLRGVALLGVLLFHANGALPGGFLGVDLFFVLSGFLITSLLLAEHRHTGRIVLSSFWVRRARRLFPALLSLMPAIAIYGRFFAKPEELAGLRADALATLGYVANWRAIFSHKSYWDLFAAPSPLEHTWSLAIEEQFYIVWPLVVAILLRRHTKRALLGLALGLILLSMALMVGLFDAADSSRVYLGTDTRAAGILAGAALATFISPDTTPFYGNGGRGPARWLDLLGVVAAVGLGVAWWKLTGDSPFLYRGGLWLTEVAAVALIACATMGPETLISRALSWRPLTLLGTISYGIYLWHWPVDVFLTPARLHVHGVWLHVLRAAITFAIAGVSYRFIERPIQIRGIPFGRPIYMVPAAVALSVFLVVRATHARPLPQAQLPPAPAVAESMLADPPPFQLMLLGDSTANSLGWGLRGVRKPGVHVELRGQDGCTMLADMCGGSSWAELTDDLQPDATLVVLGGAFMHGISAGGQWQKACHREWDTKFRSTLARRLEDLTSPGGQVWAVTVPYALGVWDVPAIRAEVDCINASIRAAAASVPDVRVLELAEHLCPKGSCELELDGAEIRPDGVHFSVDGARGLSSWVLDQIQR
jgi:peptidoglycan/LPS O-acetylase OafA/YrhL